MRETLFVCRSVTLFAFRCTVCFLARLALLALFRDKGVKNTQFLEVIVKQQNEAQAAAAAAMIAQNDALKNFQHIIVSIVVTLS